MAGMTTSATDITTIPGLHATTPERLSFAPSLEIRAFVLEREPENLLIYSTSNPEPDLPVARQYLNHSHEAMFGLAPGVRLIHHAAETPHVDGHGLTFSRRHTVDGDFEAIPTPGHTPGATAYLWDTGEHRLLFTGDTIYINRGEWVAGVLESSDRERYIESLELIRDLDFDVLVPWAASVGGPYLMAVDAAERRERIDTILARVRAGGDH
jgi:glyoxylase-like metal-dependent hydrolase (beta-lactamase superfamily II)